MSTRMEMTVERSGPVALAELVPASANGAAGDGEAIAELRELLIEQRRLLVQQAQAIDLLDQRREAFDDLVDVTMPIANAALTLVLNRLDALEKSGMPAAGSAALRDVRAAVASPAPGLWQLWKRVRSPATRRGLAVVLEIVKALGTGEPAASDEVMQRDRQ